MTTAPNETTTEPTTPAATPKTGSGPLNLTSLIAAVQCGPHRVVELRAPYRPGHAAEISLHISGGDAAGRRLTIGMKPSECLELARRLMEVAGSPYDDTCVESDEEDNTDRERPVAGDEGGVLGSSIHGELLESVSLGGARYLQIALATTHSRPILNLYGLTARPGAPRRRRFFVPVYGRVETVQAAFARAGKRLDEVLASRQDEHASRVAPAAAPAAEEDARRPMGTAGQARRRSTMEDDLRVRPKGAPPESFVAATQGTKVGQ